VTTEVPQPVVTMDDDDSQTVVVYNPPSQTAEVPQPGVSLAGAALDVAMIPPGF
jgi:hypothetical protein